MVLTTNAGASFTFASLAITATSGRGLVANVGGTINIGGTTNAINATGGAAVRALGRTVGRGTGGVRPVVVVLDPLHGRETSGAPVVGVRGRGVAVDGDSTSLRVGVPEPRAGPYD